MDRPVHMSPFEKVVPEGNDWVWTASQWALLLLTGGRVAIFHDDAQASTEITVHSTLVIPPRSRITLTVSDALRATFSGTTVRISSLTSFLTPAERQYL